MKEREQNHTQDLLEIRAMMARSSKFIWLSGWAGIIAGFFALTEAYIALLDFNPNAIDYQPANGIHQVIFSGIAEIYFFACLLLISKFF